MNRSATAPREGSRGVGAGSFYSLPPALGKPEVHGFGSSARAGSACDLRTIRSTATRE